MVKFKISFLSILFLCTAFPQTELYTPINIKSAYEKGTRSIDGLPGKAYWQNSADYIIEAFLDPSSRILNGVESIRYYNNSPDTLKKIVLRLYQDFYKTTAVRDFELTEDFLTEGVTIESISMGKEKFDLYDRKKISRSRTNLTVVPANPVLPGTAIDIRIEWSFTISAGAPIRMGSYDSVTAFVAYWYPQVSVYDDISGWDESTFGGEKEFYNDFNNYDVKITVPAGIGVWATGVLQNPESVFTNEFLEKYRTALESDSVIHIIKKEDLSKQIYSLRDGKSIWHFRADNVTDFAFAAAGNHLWDAVSFKSDSLQQRTLISAVYKTSSEDFYKVAQITREAVEYFSSDLPGIAYPYPSLTVFNGSGGMEFPMIINNGSESTHEAARRLTSHEAVHQYFPFYVGLNERKYAWMDEGLAVMLPFRFQEKYGYKVRQVNLGLYESRAGREFDIPPMIPSLMVTGFSYRTAAYQRPSVAFEILEEILGRDTFRSCIQEFTQLWQGKHPVPNDFFYTFNKVSGQNLNWFWIPWFFESGYPDLALSEAVQKDTSLKITIEKRGRLPVPLIIMLTGEGGELMKISKTAAVWNDNNKEIIIEDSIHFKVKRIEIDANIPDINRENNYYHLY